MKTYPEYEGTPNDGDGLVWDETDKVWKPAAGGGGGVTDHGLLTGLGDDDHLQYHNDARGDARYYTQSQVDTALSGKSNTGHSHASGSITDLSEAIDDRVAALLAAGSNISITYDDGTNTLTISASGSGGGNDQLAWLGL